jgi:hypothetical protein
MGESEIYFVFFRYKQNFRKSSCNIQYIMTGKSTPKLLKMVCKQAEFMRLPFRVSPWTSNISQQTGQMKKKNKNKKKTKTNSLNINKTEKKNQSNKAKLNL